MAGHLQRGGGIKEKMKDSGQRQAKNKGKSREPGLEKGVSRA